jgi:uncharacterized protein YjbI with pentapeptide repeats
MLSTREKFNTLLNMALVKSTFLEKRVAIKSTLPLNCIFLINTNFHGETFSDATFYGAIFNEVGNFGGVKFNNGVSFNSAKFIKYASFATAKFNDEVSFNLAKFNKNVAFGGTEFNGENYRIDY